MSRAGQIAEPSLDMIPRRQKHDSVHRIDWAVVEIVSRDLKSIHAECDAHHSLPPKVQGCLRALAPMRTLPRIFVQRRRYATETHSQPACHARTRVPPTISISRLLRRRQDLPDHDVELTRMWGGTDVWRIALRRSTEPVRDDANENMGTRDRHAAHALYKATKHCTKRTSGNAARAAEPPG